MPSGLTCLNSSYYFGIEKKIVFFLVLSRKFYGTVPLYVRERKGSRYVRVRTRILLDKVACTGREYNLGYCRHNRWGQIRCNRQRLAGVMCDPGPKILIKTPPLDNSSDHVDVSNSITNQIYIYATLLGMVRARRRRVRKGAGADVSTNFSCNVHLCGIVLCR